MAVIRQLNVLGSMRLDVPHIRLIESGVAGDFQALCGTLLAGTNPLIVYGAAILDTGFVGQQAETLKLRMASSILLHGTASEAGAIYTVADDVDDDTLNSANANVSGSFVSGASVTNYVSLDLVRTADPATSNTAVFRSSSTGAEFTQVVPLARVLKYVIHITTTDFDATPTYAPIAKVVVGTSGEIISITDCRQMYWRLGTGGTSPDALAKYAWANRDESTSTSGFAGGDKDITSQYDWNRAISTRLWELGGGEHWYSPTADREVKLIAYTNDVFPGSGTNWYWDGTNLFWAGIAFSFVGTSATLNYIAPNDNIAVPLPVGALADGEAIYVDLQRGTHGAVLTPYRATITSLPTSLPTIPGSRQILAFRVGSKVFVGDSQISVDIGTPHASNTSFGAVRLWSSYVPDEDNPIVPVMDRAWSATPTDGGNVVARGITRDIAGGTLAIGAGATDDSVSISKTSAITSILGSLTVAETVEVTGVITIGSAIDRIAAGTLTVGGTTATGVSIAKSGVSTSIQGSLLVESIIDRVSSGALAIGGTTATEVGLGASAIPVKSYGLLNAYAGAYVQASSGGAALGVMMMAAGGRAITAQGAGASEGISSSGGPTNGTGVVGNGGGAGGIGIYGVGAATFGVGVYGAGGGTGNGVYGIGGSSGAGVYGQAPTGGNGVIGNTGSGKGVWGAATTGVGVYGSAMTGDAIFGAASETGGVGLRGVGGAKGYGLVAGAGAGGIGVLAQSGSKGAAVMCQSLGGGVPLYIVPSTAPTSPVSGSIYISSSDGKLYMWFGGAWRTPVLL